MKSEDLVSESLVLEALRKDKGENALLVSWTLGIGANPKDNFFNIVKRINVKFSVGDRQQEVSYMAKLNPCKGDDDAFNPYRQRAMCKEVFFYDQLLPLLNEILLSKGEVCLKVPDYLCSQTEIGREVIIFQDLRPLGYETIDRTIPLKKEFGILMTKEICRFHIASRSLQKMRDRDLGEEFPLLIESWLCDDPLLSDGFAKLFRKGFTYNYYLAKALGGYDELLPWLKDLSNNGMEKIKKEILYDGPWRSVVHADFHRTNVMFKYDDQRNPIDIMMIDWQTIRMTTLAAELNYLIYSSFRESIADITPVILDTYCNTFAKIDKQEMFFTKEELKKAVATNNFGFLLCFSLIPLSVCVSCPEELFKIDDESLEKFCNVESANDAKRHLKDTPPLKPLITGLLNEARKKEMYL